MWIPPKKAREEKNNKTKGRKKFHTAASIKVVLGLSREVKTERKMKLLLAVYS